MFRSLGGWGFARVGLFEVGGGTGLWLALHVALQLCYFLAVTLFCSLACLLRKLSLHIPFTAIRKASFLFFLHQPLQVTTLKSLLLITPTLPPVQLVANFWWLLSNLDRLLLVDAYRFMLFDSFSWLLGLLVRWTLCHFWLCPLLETGQVLWLVWRLLACLNLCLRRVFLWAPAIHFRLYFFIVHDQLYWLAVVAFLRQVVLFLYLFHCFLFARFSRALNLLSLWLLFDNSRGFLCCLVGFLLGFFLHACVLDLDRDLTWSLFLFL